MRSGSSVLIFMMFALTTVQASTVEDLQPLSNDDVAPVFDVTDPAVHAVAHAVNDAAGTELIHAPHGERDADCAAINYQSDFGSDCDAPPTCEALNVADPTRTRFTVGVGNDRFDPADADLTMTDDQGIEDTQDAAYVLADSADVGEAVNLQYFGADYALGGVHDAGQSVTITVATADCQYTDLQDPESQYYEDNRQTNLSPPADHPDWVLYKADVDLACPDEHSDVGQNRLIINQKKAIGYAELGDTQLIFSDGSKVTIPPSHENRAVTAWATTQNFDTTLVAAYTYAPAGHENHFMLVEGNCAATVGGPSAGTDASANFAWFTPLTEGPFVVEITLDEGLLLTGATGAPDSLLTTAAATAADLLATDPLFLLQPRTVSCDTDICTDGFSGAVGKLKSFSGPSVPLTS